ncbi:PadR family transcriptional regulator [Providencia burhodogranariea]|uniref:PadR family transcriptional regulator n=1 Tax=Providencia burhodogranariea DSM 19968 TaxID=1141662 RepID=K8WQ07_9GAMM|nr:PadR family transcriptional regulator [Providencia burhodogranariea]EKT62698.1 PadR family transcriptional regulator [Providencia burhodogranariea DSM 19968]
MTNEQQAGQCTCDGKSLSRMFNPKQLRVYILYLLADGSNYGYELIKKIGLETAGFYCPSPGVIYPTLTLLEELGFIVAQKEQGKGRKCYSLTPEGKCCLLLQADMLAEVKLKLSYAQELKAGNQFAKEVELAVDKFKSLLRHKIVLQELTKEQSTRVVEIINSAVERIEQVNLVLTAKGR